MNHSLSELISFFEARENNSRDIFGIIDPRVVTSFKFDLTYVQHIRHALRYWTALLNRLGLTKIIDRLTAIEQMQGKGLLNVDPSSQVIGDFDVLHSTLCLQSVAIKVSA